MHYFTRGDETAVAETAASATRLEARGFEPCPYAAFRAAWAERDRLRRLEMEREDARAGARQEHAPVLDPGPAMERGGKVYPSSWKGN